MKYLSLLAFVLILPVLAFAAPDSFGLCEIVSPVPTTIAVGDTLQLIILQKGAADGNGEELKFVHYCLVYDSVVADLEASSILLSARPPGQLLVPPYSGQEFGVCLQRIYGRIVPLSAIKNHPMLSIPQSR